MANHQSKDTMALEAIELNKWLSKIESFHPEEIELGLARIAKIAESMGLLKPNAKVIIVGGTNGKGSCVATLESLALQSKIDVACYTSPHLMTFNERIRINGSNVSDRELIDAFCKIEACRRDVPLTFFEYTTLAALQVFATKNLDLIVLEVGLGGRLDAVNIIEPDVAIITTIAKDHTDWLGDTLEEIAVEKVGIYRNESLNLVGDEATFELLKTVIANSKVKFHLMQNNELNPIMFQELVNDKILNPFQLKRQNIECALVSFISLFKESSQNIDLKGVFKNIYIAGRFQKHQNRPLVITDVAHNPQAASNLLNQIESLSCNGSRIAICGLMKDKAIKEYIQTLDECIDIWIFVDLPSKRGALATDLMQCLSLEKESSDCGKTPHKVFNSLKLACDHVDSIITDLDHLYTIGSFITVAEFLKLERTF